ncbi:MAG: hypothetical protein EXR99_07230 [Gemmataceae bacterium]|nr:hypothetical protein [Gemmataceae bacterium]
MALAMETHRPRIDSRQRGLKKKSFLVFSLLAILAWLGWRLYYIVAGGNFYTVKPGLIYRCSQLSPSRLEKTIREHGIKTVVNLRGCCDTVPWYLDQCQAVNACGISQEDLSFSAGRLPSTKTLALLVDVIDHSEKPILFHCHKGIDRTGMAVTMSLLLLTETSFPEAIKQLGPGYGHLAVGRPGHIDEFFELYSAWLQSQGLTHSPDIFRNWAKEKYIPGDCLAQLTWQDHSSFIDLEAGKYKALNLRAKNISLKPWVFKPGSNAGIKLKWLLIQEDGKTAASGLSGHLQARVNPGESIELELVLPPLEKPGKYLLRADLNDPQHARFHQTGSEILETTVVVR